MVNSSDLDKTLGKKCSQNPMLHSFKQMAYKSSRTILPFANKGNWDCFISKARADKHLT